MLKHIKERVSLKQFFPLIYYCDARDTSNRKVSRTIETRLQFNSEIIFRLIRRSLEVDGASSKASSRRDSHRSNTHLPRRTFLRADANPSPPPSSSTYFPRVTAYMTGRKTSLDVVSIARLICSPDNGPPSLPSPAIHRT